MDSKSDDHPSNMYGANYYLAMRQVISLISQDMLEICLWKMRMGLRHIVISDPSSDPNRGGFGVRTRTYPKIRILKEDSSISWNAFKSANDKPREQGLRGPYRTYSHERTVNQ